MSGLPWVCYTGRIIQSAVVHGPSRVIHEAVYVSSWKMRCTLCGARFMTTTRLLSQRQHQHICDPEVKEAFKASGEQVRSIHQAAIKARLIRLRGQTPTEVGLHEAKAYARRQLLDNSEDAQLLNQSIAQQDQEVIDHITKQR